MRVTNRAMPAMIGVCLLCLPQPVLARPQNTIEEAQVVLTRMCLPLVVGHISAQAIAAREHLRKRPTWLLFSSSVPRQEYDAPYPDVEVVQLSENFCSSSIRSGSYKDLERSVAEALNAQGNGWHLVNVPTPLGPLVQTYYNGDCSVSVQTTEVDPKRLPANVARFYRKTDFEISVQSSPRPCP